MTNPTEKETTAAEAVKYLSTLAVKFNDSATRPESAAQLLEAVTSFVESLKDEKLQADGESVKGWAETVQLLLKRADQLKAANKSDPAKGNIDEALSILDRLKDPAFAASRAKKTPVDKAQPTMAVMPSVMVGDQSFVILGRSEVTEVPPGFFKPSAPTR